MRGSGRPCPHHPVCNLVVGRSRLHNADRSHVHGSVPGVRGVRQPPRNTRAGATTCCVLRTWPGQRDHEAPGPPAMSLLNPSPPHPTHPWPCPAHQNNRRKVCEPRVPLVVELGGGRACVGVGDAPTNNTLDHRDAAKTETETHHHELGSVRHASKVGHLVGSRARERQGSDRMTCRGVIV